IAIRRYSAPSMMRISRTAIAQRLQRRLIGWAVVRRHGAGDAVELNHHRTLVHSGLVGLCRHPAREKTAAPGLDRWSRERRVSGERLWIFHRAIGRNPICLRHGPSSLLLTFP